MNPRPNLPNDIVSRSQRLLTRKRSLDHLDTHFILNCKANRNTDRGHNRNWFIRVDVRVPLYTIP